MEYLKLFGAIVVLLTFVIGLIVATDKIMRWVWCEHFTDLGILRNWWRALTHLIAFVNLAVFLICALWAWVSLVAYSANYVINWFAMLGT